MDQPVSELTPWVDILPPPPPTSGISLWFIAVLLVITVSLLFLLLRYWYTRPRQRALRQLKRIEFELNKTTQNTKQLAFAVAESLQAGFGVRQLTQIVPLFQKPQVQLFCSELRRGCYQATSPSIEELTGWLQQARHLLQQTRLFHVRR